MSELYQLVMLVLLLAPLRETIGSKRWGRVGRGRASGKSFWEQVKYHPLSYLRNVQIYSRFGHYLSINEKGEVGATWDRHSPDAVLEMSSYGVKYKRIRRPNSNYLAIDKVGRVTTRAKRTNDTLFREHHGGSWMWYSNDETKYILALKKNGKPRNKVTDRHHKTKTQFLVIPLCGRVRCLSNGVEDVR